MPFARPPKRRRIVRADPYGSAFSPDSRAPRKALGAAVHAGGGIGDRALTGALAWTLRSRPPDGRPDPQTPPFHSERRVRVTFGGQSMSHGLGPALHTAARRSRLPVGLSRAARACGRAG